MEINTSKNTIVASATPPTGAYDFDSIVTHEAGHFLGLAHTSVETAVMYAYYKPGSAKLTQDVRQRGPIDRRGRGAFGWTLGTHSKSRFGFRELLN